MVVRGLTDKESLSLLMTDSRAERDAWAHAKKVAARGLQDPAQLTPDEIRELCESVMHLVGRRESR